MGKSNLQKEHKKQARQKEISQEKRELRWVGWTLVILLLVGAGIILLVSSLPGSKKIDNSSFAYAKQPALEAYAPIKNAATP